MTSLSPCILPPQLKLEYGTPYSQASAVLLPRVMEYLAAADPKPFLPLSRLLGCKDAGGDASLAAKLAVQRVRELAKKAGYANQLKPYDVHVPLYDDMSAEVVKARAASNEMSISPHVPNHRSSLCPEPCGRARAEARISPGHRGDLPHHLCPLRPCCSPAGRPGLARVVGPARAAAIFHICRMHLKHLRIRIHTCMVIARHARSR